MKKIKTSVIERNGSILTIDVTLTKGEKSHTYRQDVINVKNEDEARFLEDYANEYYYGVFGEYAFNPPVLEEPKKPWYKFGS